MEDSPTEVVCANGDLYRVHDSTQAQRTDRSTRVFQKSSTARAAQSKDLDIGDPHNVLDICQDFLNRFDPLHRQM